MVTAFSHRPGWSPPQWRLFDPQVRAERRRRRARRGVGYRLLATLGLCYLTSRVSSDPGLELGELFWATAAAMTGLSTAGAGAKLWRLERGPRFERQRPVLRGGAGGGVPSRADPPPPITSAAYAPITRLVAREHALSELLTMLGSTAGDAWPEASAAAAALRRLAGQLIVLESARRGVPPEARPGLDAALGTLRLRLDEGVSAYDLVVAAAIDAVAAAADGRVDDAAAIRRLSEAADSLAGLARGLREVRELPVRLH